MRLLSLVRIFIFVYLLSIVFIFIVLPLDLLSIVFIGLPLVLIFPWGKSQSIRQLGEAGAFSQSNLSFLEEVLQAIEESDSDPNIVYPLLETHLDQLDETFAQRLYQWATATFPPLESEQAYEVARVIFEFSTLIQQFRLGNRGSNLEIAIKGYQAIAPVFTRDAFPYEWARTQNNLGEAYWNRIRGEKAENLEAAISCYREALKVYTLAALPYEWANTQTNLGVAYSNRIQEDRAENLELAIACWRESLKVYTPDAFPQECLLSGRNLGNLAFWEENWQLAIEAYSKAVEAVELSRSWAMTPQSKQEVMEADIDVYRNIVQTYLNTEQIPRALEYVERSKTRNLVELMATRDLKPRGDFSLAILVVIA